MGGEPPNGPFVLNPDAPNARQHRADLWRWLAEADCPRRAHRVESGTRTRGPAARAAVRFGVGMMSLPRRCASTHEVGTRRASCACGMLWMKRSRSNNGVGGRSTHSRRSPLYARHSRRRVFSGPCLPGGRLWFGEESVLTSARLPDGAAPVGSADGVRGVVERDGADPVRDRLQGVVVGGVARVVDRRRRPGCGRSPRRRRPTGRAGVSSSTSANTMSLRGARRTTRSPRTSSVWSRPGRPTDPGRGVRDVQRGGPDGAPTRPVSAGHGPSRPRTP